jgi:aminoglycoside phosphotransferase family enzyme/predicted kinase
VDLAQELARSLGRDSRIQETHVSWVIVAGSSAYKLKKPLRYPFVDQSTPELRRALCEEEVRVNQLLAAPIVRGVAAIVRGPRGLELGPPGSPGALDHVVEMRRFRDADTLAGRLATGRAHNDQLREVGRALAGFHAETPPAADLGGPGHRWIENLAELSECLNGADPGALATLGTFGPAHAHRWAGELARRAARGLAVDGHGDLRAEHVLLEGDKILVVDRLEFDPALRHADVAEDLAFLTMDLERLGARWAAELVVDGYLGAGGDPGPPELLAFFAAYRALVRAKVAALAQRQAEAQALVNLAVQLSWRARRPLRVIVTGPPASGKSTLADALADVACLPHVASDMVRPRDADGHGRYDAGSRADVYRMLGHAARRLDSFVIDATFGEPALQGAFLELAGSVDQLAVVECGAPEDVLLDRAERRPSGSAGGSEAGPAVAAALLERHVPFAPDGASWLRVDTTADTAAIVTHVAQWLDRAHS